MNPLDPKYWTSLPLKSLADKIIDGATQILRGWDAKDITTHDAADWDAIPWKRFYATAHHYIVSPVYLPPSAAGERPRLAEGQYRITLLPSRTHGSRSSTVYVSDKYGPFIQSMREAMWQITPPLPPPMPKAISGFVYIALQGPPCKRERWTIPLYAPGVSQEH